MKNYNYFSKQLQAKFYRFTNLFINVLSKSELSFINYMLIGMLGGNSVVLSNIARNIVTKTNKMKTKYNCLQRIFTKFKKLSNIQDIYLENSKHYIKADTIIAIDDSDLCKAERRKAFECLAKVRDGSTKTIKYGYYLASAVAISNNKKMNPIPLYQKAYSLSQKAVTSRNLETIEQLNTLQKSLGTKGIYTFDRGYDNKIIIRHLLSKDMSFIIRMTSKRDLIHKGVKQNIIKIVNQYKGKRNIQFKLKGENKHGKVSETIVSLPGNSDMKLKLILVYMRDGRTLIFLTNVENKSGYFIAKSYFLRWRIEEYFKFIKQGYDLENFRCRKITQLNLILFLLQIITYMLAQISNQEHKLDYFLRDLYQVIFKNKKIKFTYHQLANSISILLIKTLYYIKKKTTKTETNRQLSLDL